MKGSGLIEENNKNEKKKKRVLLVIMLCLLMVIAGLVVGIIVSDLMKKNQQDNITYDSGITDIVEQETIEPETIIESIAIPCFETMILKADSTEQEVNFYNPEKNTGIDFQLTMFIVPEDESQEDMEIWKSGLIPSGKAIYSIVLNQPLEKGTYKAKLQYSCFSQSGSALNGSVLNFNLLVE